MSLVCGCRAWREGHRTQFSRKCKLVSSGAKCLLVGSFVNVECPLAHVCPYLRGSPNAEIDKLPKDHIQKLLQKCPRLANSPQAKHHVAAAIMGDDTVKSKEKCPYLARPDDDASMHVWEDFYKKSAECPWIHEHGIGDLAKSPKAWEAALEVSILFGVGIVLIYRDVLSSVPLKFG